MVVLVWLLQATHRITEGSCASCPLRFFYLLLNHLLEVVLKLGFGEKVFRFTWKVAVL